MNRLYLIPAFAVLVASLALINWLRTPEQVSSNRDTYLCEARWEGSPPKLIEVNSWEWKQFTTQHPRDLSLNAYYAIGNPPAAPEERRLPNSIQVEVKVDKTYGRLILPEGSKQMKLSSEALQMSCYKGPATKPDIAIQYLQSKIRCEVNGETRNIQLSLIEKNQTAILATPYDEEELTFGIYKESFYEIRHVTKSDLGTQLLWKLELPMNTTEWTLELNRKNRPLQISCLPDSKYPMSEK